jgi:hypothetical protein
MLEYGNPKSYYIRNYQAVQLPNDSWQLNDGELHWYNVHGEFHNIIGPALIYTNGEVAWYLNDTRYFDFAEWLTETPISDEHKMLLRLQYA